MVNQCYILQENLGEDSVCELWRASSIYSATQFLLRFIKTGMGFEAGLDEFRKLAMDSYSITAPAIMDFVEIERWGERSFIGAEFGGQRHLLAYYGASPQIRLEHACRFVIELGQGLDAFHKRGIVYGCLNAENVLVTCQAGIVDTIRIQKPGYLPFLRYLAETDARSIFENWAYVAPEIKSGSKGDRRSDIYSLAVHLFRFIVGKLPYSTAKRAKTGSVSLSYVSKALSRRGVPLSVSRVVLKALRKDPRQRPSEVLELIAELRAFMDERRRDILARGEVDPVAELLVLNLGKDRVDATQAIKSLDTADYFRSLSQAWMAPSTPGPILLFPVEDFESPTEVDRMEAAEAEGDEDDGRRNLDSYIEEAVRSLKGETASRRPNAPIPESPAPTILSTRGKAAAGHEDGLRPPPIAEGGDAGVPGAGKGFDTENGPVAGKAGSAATSTEAPAVGKATRQPPRFMTPEPPRAAPITVGAFASDPAPRRRKKSDLIQENVDAGGVSWRPYAALLETVVAGMEGAFTHAFKGTGAFRFIQEPPPGPGAVAFARIFARFRARGLVADLGTVRAGADATDLLRLLRSSLAEGLSYESPQARAVLAKRLRLIDRAGAFSAAPLGALLLGSDGEEPDPDWTESTEGAMRSALVLASLGRRRRPLVLTMRGCEAVGPSAHAILVELARLAPIASFCCFAFYKPAPVPSWHVLSRLGMPVPPRNQ